MIELEEIIKDDDVTLFSKHYNDVRIAGFLMGEYRMIYSKEYKHETICMICCDKSKPNIYNYIVNNYEVNYNKTFDYMTFRELKLCDRDIFKDILSKVDVQEINVLNSIHKDILDDEDVINLYSKIKDKSGFNKLIIDRRRGGEYTIFCLQFATDEEAIDNALLKHVDLKDCICKINDVNRQFNEEYFDTHKEKYHVNFINQYGLIAYCLTNKNSDEVQKLVNKNALLKVKKIESRDKIDIDIQSLKYIEDCENFHDFIKLNKLLLMNSAKTDEEAEYLLNCL